MAAACAVVYVLISLLINSVYVELDVKCHDRFVIYKTIYGIPTVQYSTVWYGTVRIGSVTSLPFQDNAEYIYTALLSYLYHGDVARHNSPRPRCLYFFLKGGAGGFCFSKWLSYPQLPTLNCGNGG